MAQRAAAQRDVSAAGTAAPLRVSPSSPQGLRFRASSVRIGQASLGVAVAPMVISCRFLYSPTTAASLYTYNGAGRGGGVRTWLSGNIFEFGEGAPDPGATTGGGVAYSKGAGSIVVDNYFAFNSWARPPARTTI